MQGVVRRIVSDKGFGFIQSNGKDYFFHRSSLKNISFDDLRIGQEVQFEDAITDRGPRAEDIYAD